MSEILFKDINPHITLIINFLSFLMLSSLFLSINGFLKIYFSFLLMGLEFNLKLALATLFVTFSVYNVNKLTDKKEDMVNMPKRANYLENREPIIAILLILSYAIALILGFLEGMLTIPILLFPFVSGVFYSIKIISDVRLKDIFIVKNIITALPWAVISTFLPIIGSHQITASVILSIFYFFLIKSFINTVLFDVRDIEGDRKNKTKTIPVVFGIKKTRNLLLQIHSTLLIWLGVSLYFKLFNEYLPALMFSIIYGYCYILYFCRKSKAHERDFFIDLIVDGEWIFLSVIGCIVFYL